MNDEWKTINSCPENVLVLFKWANGEVIVGRTSIIEEIRQFYFRGGAIGITESPQLWHPIP